MFEGSTENVKIEEREKKSNFNDYIKIKKNTFWKMSTILLLVLLLFMISSDTFNGENSEIEVKKESSAQYAASPSQDSNDNSKNIAKQVADDDPFLGNKDAPITIVEFSDFQCPFCKRFHEQTLEQIKSQYIDTGKVKFVYRDFPLESIHSQAKPAAMAAECAREQNKFWEYHDILFERQQIWSNSGITEFKKYAQELGLNAKKFDECFDSGKYNDEVIKDMNDAVAAGGRGTPYFIVGNQPVSGAQPFEAFKAVIDSQL